MLESSMCIGTFTYPGQSRPVGVSPIVRYGSWDMLVCPRLLGKAGFGAVTWLFNPAC